MNCLEFRRQLNIDPQCNETDFVHHRQECPRCADALERAGSFEASMRQALAVPLPPQLAESILLAQATRQQHQRQRYQRGGMLLAMAAAVVLAFGIGMRVQAKPLQVLAVDHMNREAEVLGMTKPVADGDVRKAFAERGIVLTKVPGDISFVYCCPVGRYQSVHMVMPQSDGPITVLYLSDDNREAHKDFTQSGWSGRSVPLAHGTLVMLGHDASHFDHIENVWRNALQSAVPGSNARI